MFFFCSNESWNKADQVIHKSNAETHEGFKEETRGNNSSGFSK